MAKQRFVQAGGRSADAVILAGNGRALGSVRIRAQWARWVQTLPALNGDGFAHGDD